MEAAPRSCLRGLFIDEPITYRLQNRGDYEIPSGELGPRLEAKGVSRFGLHVRPRE